MESQPSNIISRTIFLILLVVTVSCSSTVEAQSGAQSSSSSSSSPVDQRGFATPQLAAEALITSAEVYDVRSLLEIFGPGGKDFIESADSVRDMNIAHQFAEKARQKHSVSVNNTRATLLVGQDEWPMPIPIVKKQGKWYFDTKAGRDEILFYWLGKGLLASGDAEILHECIGRADNRPSNSTLRLKGNFLDSGNQCSSMGGGCFVGYCNRSV